MAKDGARHAADQSLMLRAAWLHYVGGLTQTAVAQKLGVPSVKAHRLIARAVEAGAVKVSIEGEIVECIELEDALCKRFGLESCDVAPDLAETGLPFRALSLAAAARLRWWMESSDVDTIGIGHGRTLAAMARELPRFEATGLRFVSLMGELTRNYTANPHTVMNLLAEKTGAQSYVFPVPFFANSAEDRDVLLAQRGVRDVFEMAQAALLKLIGIGSAEMDTQLVQSGMISPEEMAEIVQAGGVGEMLGYFFDEGGSVLETHLSNRTLATDIDGVPEGRLVAIAGGAEKISAIRAVLRSGKLSGLVTDESSARALLVEG